MNRITEQLLYLFVLAMPVACVAWTITHEEVFREPRDWCLQHSQTCRRLAERKFFYVFTCEYCFSHYVAAFFGHIGLSVTFSPARLSLRLAFDRLGDLPYEHFRPRASGRTNANGFKSKRREVGNADRLKFVAPSGRLFSSYLLSCGGGSSNRTHLNGDRRLHSASNACHFANYLA